MAILDWPTGRAFQPRPDSEFGLRSPKSAFTGFFTATQQSITHDADRWHARIVLGPCNHDDGQAREAFINRLLNGDRVRLPHLLRRSSLPTGSLRGSPTLSASALAGARSLSIANAFNGNLITAGRSFGNAAWLLDGMQAPLTDYYTEPEGTITADMLVEDGSTGTHSIYQDRAVPASPVDLTFSCLFTQALRSWCVLQITELTGGTACQAYFQMSGANGVVGTTFVGANWANLEAGSVLVDPVIGWYRFVLVATKVNAAALVRVRIWSASADGNVSFTGNNNQCFSAWGARLETGRSAGSYALPTLKSGDMANLGTQLVQVRDDVVFSDLGTGTVAINNAVRSTQAISTPLVTSSPTAIMMLPSDEVMHRGGRASWHREIEIPLVEAS